MKPDRLLTDGVIALRPFTMDDVPALTRACQDPEISRWTIRIPWPYSRSDARQWISTHEKLWSDRTEACLAIIAEEFTKVAVGSDDPGVGHIEGGDEGGDDLVGSVSLQDFRWEDRSCAVGYWIAQRARRRGFATRAVNLVSEWAFDELGIESIDLSPLRGNEASEGVAMKAGYVNVGAIADHSHPARKAPEFTSTRWTKRRPGHTQEQ